MCRERVGARAINGVDPHGRLLWLRQYEERHEERTSARARCQLRCGRGDLCLVTSLMMPLMAVAFSRQATTLV